MVEGDALGPPLDDGSGGQLRRRAMGMAAVFGGQIVSAVGSFAAAAIIARQLGPDAYGRFYTFLAASLVATQLLDLGLGRALVASLSRSLNSSDQSSQFRAAAYLRLSTSLLFAGALGATVLLYHSYQAVAFFWAAVVGAAIGLQQQYLSLYQLHHRFARMGAVNAVLGAARLLGILVMLVSGVLGTGTAIAVFVASALVVLVLTAAMSPVRFRHRGPVSRTAYRYLLMTGGWLALAGVLEAAYQRLDLFSLSFVASPFDIGLYSSALTLLLPLFYIPLAVNTITFPRMTQSAARGDTGALRREFRWSTMMIALFVLPCLLVIVVQYPGISLTVIGLRFSGAMQWVLMLSPYVGLFALHYNCGAVFLALERPRMLASAATAALATTFACVVVLVPRYHLGGAAASMGAGALASLVYSWLAVRRLLGDLPPLGYMALILVISLAAEGASLLLRMDRPLLQLGLRLIVIAVVTVALGLTLARRLLHELFGNVPDPVGFLLMRLRAGQHL